MSRKSVQLSTQTVNTMLLDCKPDSGMPLQDKIVSIMQSNFLFNGIEDLVAPTFLSNQSGSFKLVIKLTADQAEKLGMGRDFSKEPPDHQFKVILRTCRFFEESFELDCYNGISAVTINTSQLKFQNIAKGPLDITQFLKISPLAENMIYLDRQSASQALVVGVYFVSEPTAGAIVRKLLKTPSQLLASENTRNKLSTVHSDEGVLYSELSLVCPLTQKRITIPVHGKNCQHLACFDASSFINMGLAKHKKGWICPICNSPVPPDDLVVDGFILEVLEKLESERDDSTKIRMGTNGEWSPVHNCSVTIIEILDG